MKWTSTTGNTLEVLPWTENGFVVITLDCEESLGGSEAHGIIKMRFMPDPKEENTRMITEENTVNIKLGTTDVGTKLDIHGLITDRDYIDNFLTLSFSCFPRKDFWTNRGTLVADNIDSAIKSLWGDEKTMDIRTSTDLPDGITFNQASDYDYFYLQKLCKSYKKETVFAFGLEGLLIKDLVGIDSDNNKEPYKALIGNVQMIQNKDNSTNNGYRMSYNPKLYMNPENKWEESEIKSKYWEIRTFDNQYRMMGKENQLLRENQMYNDKFFNTFMYNQIHLKQTNFLLDFRLGDVVKYKRGEEVHMKIPWGIYIISKIVYHYRTEPDPGKNSNPTEFPFFTDYTLHCLEESGEIMSDKDPMEEN